MRFTCLLVFVCGSFLKETFVCLGFVSYPAVFLRASLESDKLLASSSFSRHYQAQSITSSASDDMREKVSRIIQSILKSPRKTTTEDVLQTVSGTDGLLTSFELLELMHGLVEKRDHERFGDVISIYTTSYGNEIERLGAIDQLSGESVSSYLGRISQFQGKTDNRKRIVIKRRGDSSNVIWHGMENDDCAAGTHEDIDLNLLILLLYSNQQMKPKKRHSQSVALLSKVIQAGLPRQLVSTFIMSIIISEELSEDDETASSTLHNIAKQYFDSSDVEKNRPPIDSKVKLNPSRCAAIDVETVTSVNQDMIKKTNLLLLKNLIPYETMRLATALTRPWKNVQGVMTEYEQHHSWRENSQNLDVTTCLNIVHATLLDKYLNLLVIQEFSAAKTNEKDVRSNKQSLLALSLDFIRFLFTIDFSIGPINEREKILCYDMKDNTPTNNLRCKYVCYSSSEFNDVHRFIRCKVENQGSGSSPTDSLFFKDQRLQKAIDLTQLNREGIKISDNIKVECKHPAGTGKEIENEYRNKVIENMENNDRNNGHDTEPIKLTELKNNEVVAHIREKNNLSCSYYDAILDSISLQPPTVSSDNEGDDVKILDRVDDNGDAGCERVVRVLSLGDGDLSFSTALIKIQEQLEKEKETKVEAAHDTNPSIITSKERIFLKSEVRTSPRLDLTVTTFESYSSLTEKYSSASNNVDFIVNTSVLNARPSRKSERGARPYRKSEEGARPYRKSEEVRVNTAGNKYVKEKMENEGIDMRNIASERSHGDDVGSKVEVEVEVEEGDEHCRVMYNIDATNITLKDISSRSFDVVIFNFPFGDAIVVDRFTAESSIRRNFETHWMARGRHMHLMEGIFRSAKNVLHKSISDSSIEGRDGVGVTEREEEKECFHDIDKENNKKQSDFDESSDNTSSDTQYQYEHKATLLEKKNPKLMITLLLSQAMEWEVEKMALYWGFKLTEIIPFEDRILSHYGYDRKRTYADDIFPSSSTLISSVSSSQSSLSPSALFFEKDSRSTAQPLTADRFSESGTMVEKSLTSDRGGEHEHKVLPPSQELSYMQRKHWERNSVTAWTFVFTHLS